VFSFDIRLTKPTLYPLHSHSLKMDYVPLITNEYKLAFVQATGTLPGDVQQIIWAKLLENTEPVMPSTPKKPIKPSPRLARLMKNWSTRRQL
jgi:hypothetical protein